MLLPPLRQTVLRGRLNRFVALVETEDGDLLPAHLPNSGRLRELMVPGFRAYVAPAGCYARAETPFPWTPLLEARALRMGQPPLRRTAVHLVLVDVGDGLLVSCDARLPPLLLAEALVQERVPSLAGHALVQREPPLADGRADLLLDGPDGPVLVETKSITLVQEGVALFPDAPTLRGARHVRALARHVVSGAGRAVVAFVAQRPDVEAVSPYDAVDPAFGQALRQAVAAGVTLLGFRCRVTSDRVQIAGEVPVVL